MNNEADYFMSAVLVGNAFSFISSAGTGATMSLFCEDILELKSLNKKLLAGVASGSYAAFKMASGSHLIYTPLAIPGSYYGFRAGFNLGVYLDEKLGVSERRRKMLKRYIKE